MCPGSKNYAFYPESESLKCVFDGSLIQEGLCSAATESLLLEEECINYVWNNKEDVFYTIRWGLILSMCRSDVYETFVPRLGDSRREILVSNIQESLISKKQTKLFNRLDIFDARIKESRPWV